MRVLSYAEYADQLLSGLYRQINESNGHTQYNILNEDVIRNATIRIDGKDYDGNMLVEFVIRCLNLFEDELPAASRYIKYANIFLCTDSKLTSTMGVSRSQNLFLINLAFIVTSLEMDERYVKLIFYHEALHNILDHQKQGDYWNSKHNHVLNPLELNICADYEVNECCVEAGLITPQGWDHLKGYYDEMFKNYSLFQICDYCSKHKEKLGAHGIMTRSNNKQQQNNGSQSQSQNGDGSQQTELSDDFKKGYSEFWNEVAKRINDEKLGKNDIKRKVEIVNEVAKKHKLKINEAATGSNGYKTYEEGQQAAFKEILQKLTQAAQSGGQSSSQQNIKNPFEKGELNKIEFPKSNNNSSESGSSNDSSGDSEGEDENESNNGGSSGKNSNNSKGKNNKSSNGGSGTDKSGENGKDSDNKSGSGSGDEKDESGENGKDDNKSDVGSGTNGKDKSNGNDKDSDNKSGSGSGTDKSDENGKDSDNKSGSGSGTNDEDENKSGSDLERNGNSNDKNGNDGNEQGTNNPGANNPGTTEPGTNNPGKNKHKKGNDIDNDTRPEFDGSTDPNEVDPDAGKDAKAHDTGGRAKAVIEASSARFSMQPVGSQIDDNLLSEQKLIDSLTSQGIDSKKAKEIYDRMEENSKRADEELKQSRHILSEGNEDLTITKSAKNAQVACAVIDSIWEELLKKFFHSKTKYRGIHRVDKDYNVNNIGNKKFIWQDQFRYYHPKRDLSPQYINILIDCSGSISVPMCSIFLETVKEITQKDNYSGVRTFPFSDRLITELVYDIPQDKVKTVITDDWIAKYIAQMKHAGCGNSYSWLSCAQAMQLIAEKEPDSLWIILTDGFLFDPQNVVKLKKFKDKFIVCLYGKNIQETWESHPSEYAVYKHPWMPQPLLIEIEE